MLLVSSSVRKTSKIQFFHQLKRIYPLSTVLSLTQIMISAQLAWLLNCPREVKARVPFRPEFFRSLFCCCSSSMTLLRRSLTSKLWLLWNSGLQRGLNPWPRDTGSTLWPTELWRHWIFQASLRNCINCIRNRDDHSLLDFTSAVQCIKYLISFHKIINVDFALCQI